MLITLLFFSSCKEELLQPKEEEKNPKVTDSKVITETLLDAQLGDENPDKKTKFEKLKKELEKPYVLLKKPQELLAEYLAARNTNKATFTSNKNLNLKSVSALCDPLYIPVWAFESYEANGEFGICPTTYRSEAGASNNAARIQKLNELHSKWGFNYILASIGLYNNIMAIVNAGFPISSNYMASVSPDQMGRNTVANIGNDLSASQYFWAYYVDEPYATFNASQYNMYLLYTDVRNTKPYSLFAIGETYSGRVTYYMNNGVYNTIPDFVMCTKYFNDAAEQDIDQRDRWTRMKNDLPGKFTRTWISANQDGSEFENLLGHCRNKNIVPWFYQLDDADDLSDYTISRYCYFAYLTSYLRRVERRYIYVWSYLGTGNPCTDNEVTNWYLSDIISTNELRTTSY
jgi:hypothetical protein